MSSTDIARGGRVAVALFVVLAAACASGTPQSRNGSALALPDGASPACPALHHIPLADRPLADSLLTEAMDNEALFTIAGELKPMSTVLQLRSASLRSEPSSNREADLARIERVQRVLDALDCGPLDFMVVPFRAVFDSLRNLSAVVVHRGVLDAQLREHSEFFGHWGLTPGADPAVVATAVEFEDRYDRLRGYGLLFGYPIHAVDFFVEAAIQGDSIGEIVPRDFLQMPVFSGLRGRYVYAVPEGWVEGPADEQIRVRATEIVAAYSERRGGYLEASGYLRALDLYRDWMEERLGDQER